MEYTSRLQYAKAFASEVITAADVFFPFRPLRSMVHVILRPLNIGIGLAISYRRLKPTGRDTYEFHE